MILKNKIIVDDKCFLRSLNLNDVNDKYIEWLNDYEVTKYTEQKNIKHTKESIKNFVLEKNNSNNNYLLGIFYKDIHIGNIKLGPIQWGHKMSDISYIIGEKKYWGKGIATKCVKKIISYSIENMMLEKINAGYYELNVGSAKVLEKCGFVIEGVRKKDVIFENKRISSIIVGFIP